MKLLTKRASECNRCHYSKTIAGPDGVALACFNTDIIKDENLAWRRLELVSDDKVAACAEFKELEKQTDAPRGGVVEKMDKVYQASLRGEAASEP